MSNGFSSSGVNFFSSLDDATPVRRSSKSRSVPWSPPTALIDDHSVSESSSHSTRSAQVTSFGSLFGLNSSSDKRRPPAVDRSQAPGVSMARLEAGLSTSGDARAQATMPTHSKRASTSKSSSSSGNQGIIHSMLSSNKASGTSAVFARKTPSLFTLVTGRGPDTFDYSIPDSPACSRGYLTPRTRPKTTVHKRMLLQSRVYLLLLLQALVFYTLCLVDHFVQISSSVLLSCCFLSVFVLSLVVSALYKLKREPPINYFALVLCHFFSAPYILFLARFLGIAFVTQFFLYYTLALIVLLVINVSAPFLSSGLRSFGVVFLLLIAFSIVFYTLIRQPLFEALGHSLPVLSDSDAATLGVEGGGTAEGVDNSSASVSSRSSSSSWSVAFQTSLLVHYTVITAVAYIVGTLSYPLETYTCYDYVVAYIDVSLFSWYWWMRRLNKCVSLPLCLLLAIALLADKVLLVSSV